MGLKISAIIPTYNRPQDLANCIQSILNQSVKPDEIIVIDDGNLDKVPFKSECKQSGIDLKYVKKKVRGVTQSDRKSVVQGKSVDLGGRRIIKKKKKK